MTRARAGRYSELVFKKSPMAAVIAHELKLTKSKTIENSNQQIINNENRFLLRGSKSRRNLGVITRLRVRRTFTLSYKYGADADVPTGC